MIFRSYTELEEMHDRYALLCSCQQFVSVCVPRNHITSATLINTDHMLAYRTQRHRYQSEELTGGYRDPQHDSLSAKHLAQQG